MKKNILIADFDKTRFWKPLKGNRSIMNQQFDTYDECLSWIDKNCGKKYWSPELGWGLGNGKYHESWEWLMPVIEQICQIEEQTIFHTNENNAIIGQVYPRTFGMVDEETKDFLFRFNGFPIHRAKKLIDCAYEAVVEVLESGIFKNIAVKNK